jgi:hypothetical protein
MFYVEKDSGQCSAEDVFDQDKTLMVDDDISNCITYVLSLTNTIHKIYDNVAGVSKKLINID